MKKTFLLFVFAVCILSISIAQSPFKYQAVMRDINGNILINKNVGLRVSIMQGTTPTTVYSEGHNKTSDQFGIINIEVGTGSVLSGNYLTINWSALNNQLQVEIDMTGGTTYTLLGTSPILSVPVANYAVKAGSSTFPAGLIMPFGGNVDKIPDGWLLCDGRAINRSEYPELFNTITVNWGGGDLSTTFNLPDLRGQFLRGLDGDANVDLDKSTRTEKYIGGSSGNNVGSYQLGAFEVHSHTGLIGYNGNHNHTGSTSTAGAHAHDIPLNSGNGIESVNTGAESGTNSVSTSTNGSHSHSLSINYNGTHTHDVSIYNSGGNETRPVNANVLYIIKY